MAKMTKEIGQKLLEWRNDVELFARECIKIKDHNTAQILPLVFNRSQRLLHAIAEKQKAEKGHVRILVIKPRRHGISTYVEGRFYHHTSLNFNRHTFIVGHEADSTSTLYKMAQLMQEKNPFAPQTRASNAQELIFDTPQGDGLKSQYRLATAGNVDAGRSQGVHYLHNSEESFWRDGSTLLTGLFQCVPDPPAESEIFRESTGNGFGNQFQEDVFATYCEGQYPYYSEGGMVYAWHNPETDWVVFFPPWFIHELYTMKFDNDDQKKKFAAKIDEKVFNRESMKWEESEEKKLRDKFRLTLEQLHWRDWAIKNKCNGSIDKFHQEYPATLEEAFLSKGSNVFSKTQCDDLEKLCTKPIMTGELVDRSGIVKFKPTVHGKLVVWEKPDEKEEYLIICDTGGGKTPSQEKEKREPDPSCIDVWNQRTGHQVAQWHGNIDYDMLDELIEMVGEYYGFRNKDEITRPMAAVELNNHGWTVVSGLSKRKYPQYENKPGEPGWLTNKRTKPQMIDGLVEASRDGSLLIASKQTVSEMRTYVEKDGHFAASSGCHDERVVTAAIASQIFKTAPFLARGRRKKNNAVRFNNLDNRKKAKQESYDYQEVMVG
jgi:hypothetical protein